MGTSPQEAEELWQQLGRLVRRVSPEIFESLLAAAEAQAKIASEVGQIDESYSEA